MNQDDLSAFDKVLLAAYDLDEKTARRPFTAEVLIVEAWQRYPSTFAMKGYAAYPDSNKVIVHIVGKRGLAGGRGLLTKVGCKLYVMTPTGRTHAKGLLEAPPEESILPPPPTQDTLLNARQERFLARFAGCEATTKTLTGLTGDLSFKDACDFWDLDMDDGPQTMTLVDGTYTVILEIDKVLQNRKEVYTSKGRAVSKIDVDNALKVHKTLRGKFSSHLHLLQNRPRGVPNGRTYDSDTYTTKRASIP